jgi:hypothetical protein
MSALLPIQQHHQLLTALHCIGDLAQAINWLPDGVLWAGKLDKWYSGALGTVTSIISLCRAYEQVDTILNLPMKEKYKLFCHRCTKII